MVDVLYSAALGLIAGLIPVYLGLIPIPFFRKLSSSNRSLFLSFSIGILMFLFADVAAEAIDLSKQPQSNPLLFAVGLITGVAVPIIISSRRKTNAPNINFQSLTAYIIAAAIGLHNLGEGLALGSAYAAGQVALTTVLVVGFAVHNGTEGMAIAGPVSDMPIGVKEPLTMGFLAGFPTVIGSVIGAAYYSDLAGTLFYSVATGALLYVIIELLIRARSPSRTAIGIVAGILLMFFTDLLLTV